MSSIITGILGSTVGLLWNKARNAAADKLKDGDTTDAKIREMVVRELNEMKTKLDGLSRKDLLTSHRFLKEGVELLNGSLDNSMHGQKALVNDAEDVSDETSSGVQFGMLNGAFELSQNMGELKLNSDKQFDSANKRFKDARKTATQAFCNEALTIEDRIFAGKLRVVSEILECLENPETAITACLSFLKDLHTLPAISEIFSVYLNRGVKSMFGKAERKENVKSVMMINCVLFQFVSKFSRKYCSPHDWPAIELPDCSFRPILQWKEISTRQSMREELGQAPNALILDDALNSPVYCAVNGRAEIVVGGHGDNIKVISKTDEIKDVKLPDSREGNVIDHHVVGLAVDINNSIFVVRCLKTRTENFDVNINYEMCVLNENYSVKHDCITLEFLHAKDPYGTNIAINKSNDIIIAMTMDPQRHVYICDHCGRLKHKFEICHVTNSRRVRSLSISENNEIMIPVDNDTTVNIYTEEGDLESTIEVPEGNTVVRVAYHHVICKVIVLAYCARKKSYRLLRYSAKGELENSTFFCNRRSHVYSHEITSHPNGPIAVVSDKKITFI